MVGTDTVLMKNYVKDEVREGINADPEMEESSSAVEHDFKETIT